MLTGLAGGAGYYLGDIPGAAIGAYTGHVLPQVGKTIMDGKHAYRYLMNNKMTPVNQAVLNALMMSAGTEGN